MKFMLIKVYNILKMRILYPDYPVSSGSSWSYFTPIKFKTMRAISLYTALFLRLIRKRIYIFLGTIMLVCAYSCNSKTCRCEDQFGNVQEGIELSAGEDCSDLEPMLGTCTEE